MSLEAYRRKRDFTATAEPRGRKVRRKGASFVIQKHAATRLHYDLRLEMAGVLRSWAVTRGPSLVPGEKRLAVHVEDHPLDYGDFEGTIPKGEYGAGTVIVWDRGTWTPIGDADTGYAKGHLEFELAGEKLSGRWHLVRMQGRRGEKRENWLLIKAEDEVAREASDPDILEEQPLSAKTGRGLDEVAAGTAGAEPAPQADKPRKRRRAVTPEETTPQRPDPGRDRRAKAAPMPGFIPPMLAQLAANAPEGFRWMHEIKFDGYRIQAHVAKGAVTLWSRGGLDWTPRFGPDLAQALAGLALDNAVIDGEVVVETTPGGSDFSALQADLGAGRSNRFVYQCFDLMYLDGRDLTGLSLLRRKEMLETLLAGQNGPLRYSEHFSEAGAMVLRHACRLGLEGVVSKLSDGPYRSGRGKGWIKSKCSDRQEFVIGGFTPSTAAAGAIGSLVLGVFEGGGLVHVGRVGTGFTDKVARDLFTRLDALRQPESPFSPGLSADKSGRVTFVRPELVAEVEFRAWTADGHLRHAAFRGLREDKPAREIVRETAEAVAAPPQVRRVTLSHPDRVYWPDAGITKEGLADYYAEVWRHIAPHVLNRPLALLRCPDGIGGQQFFQKHAWKGMNAHIRQVRDPKDPDAPLVAIADLDGLIGLAQAAVLEIHPWGSTLQDWDRPDQIVMDLDPAEGVPWDRVLEGAEEVRLRLQEAGLAAFVKTSGGKGLHVVAPLKPHAPWPVVKAFCQGMASAMAADAPDRYVATISKAKRKGRILIDYLRNQRGATAVAAFSPRARPGAAVSVPVHWQELSGIGPDFFTIKTVPTRLANLDADPWADFRAAAVPLRP